jgi:hypothetical protein
MIPTMKKRNLIAVTALALLCSGFTDKRIWIIDADSRLTIQGFTNVNKFSCALQYYTGNDTLHEGPDSGQKLLFTQSTMTIPVRSFDCGARPISRDFWTTLKSETYPDMMINFISLDRADLRRCGDVKGVMDITLAGVTARYTVCYHSTIERNGTILLTGSHSVNFSDFRLHAPEKMNGLIKVKEGLKVNFNLILKEV